MNVSSKILVLLFFCSIPVQAAELPPLRVITLSPHLAELVVSLGAADQLVGVAEYSDYPPLVKSIPRIGGATGLDFERILTLRPDLVLAWQGGTRAAYIARLTELGIRVVSIKSESLDDIPESIVKLGELLNRQDSASVLVKEFNLNKAEISAQFSNAPVQKFFIEISSQPLMALSNRHSFAEGLRLCHLQNIFADQDKAAIIIDLESVLSRHADLVLLKRAVVDDTAELLSRKTLYRIDPADSKAMKIISFDEDAAFRQTPRLLGAIEQVCKEAHYSL